MFKQCLFSVAAGTCMVLVSVAVAEPPTKADPALTGWIQEVISQNPEMQAAEAAVEAASGRLRAADQPLFNPELELEYENAGSTEAAGGLNHVVFLPTPGRMVLARPSCQSWVLAGQRGCTRPGRAVCTGHSRCIHRGSRYASAWRHRRWHQPDRPVCTRCSQCKPVHQ